MLYYVKFTALSIKTISRPLPFIVLQISAVKRGTIIKFTIYFNIGYKLNNGDPDNQIKLKIHRFMRSKNDERKKLEIKVLHTKHYN